MYKALIVMLALMLAFSFTVMADEADKIIINPEFNKEKMLTIHGEEIMIGSSDKVIGDVEMGFMVAVPEYMNGMDPVGKYQLDWDYHYIGYAYIPRSIMHVLENFENIETEEEYLKNQKILLEGEVPTIAEMPDLQNLYEALLSYVNLVTVCLDSQDDPEFTKQILAEVGATFRTLKGDELVKGILQNITGTPTTLFLDPYGNQVAMAIAGAFARSDKFVEEGLKIVQERLELLGEKK